VYNGFYFDGEENAQTVEDIVKKFEEFAVVHVNVTYAGTFHFSPEMSIIRRII